MISASCSTVRAALHGVVPGQIRRAEDGVDLGLGVHHGRAGGGDEAGLRPAQGAVLAVTLGSKVEPLVRRGAEAIDVVVDVLDGLAKRGDDGLVGAEFNDLAELLRRDLLGFLHFLGALVQRLLAPRSQQVRPLTGEARALGGKLQAGGEPRNVPPAQIDHGPAEMTEHHAGAGADDDRHAGDRGEGGKQAAFDAPMGTQKAKDAGSDSGISR